jgi:hypothetical protein
MLYNTPIIPKEGDLPRRFMSDDYFDLFVWYYPDERVHGFQLCYDKQGQERAVTWIRGKGLQHNRVDTGEALPTENRAPVLISGGDFPKAKVIAEFDRRSVRLPPDLRRLILSTLRMGGRKRPSAICALLFSITVGVFVILAFNRFDARTHNGT